MKTTGFSCLPKFGLLGFFGTLPSYLPFNVLWSRSRYWQILCKKFKPSSPDILEIFIWKKLNSQALSGRLVIWPSSGDRFYILWSLFFIWQRGNELENTDKIAGASLKCSLNAQLHRLCLIKDLWVFFFLVQPPWIWKACVTNYTSGGS